jgi:general stress protein 26
MNSINQNQVEQNKENLQGAAAVEKIKELAGKAQTCFFCTQTATAQSLGARPMSVQEVDETGALWFLIANDSYTYEDIAANPSVKLYFQGSAHAGFLHLEGSAEISTDKARIKQLWQPAYKTWFTEGEDDPRIAVVTVIPDTGYYWDNKHGNAVAAVKLLIGAAIGKTLDDSIEGKIRL